MTISNKLHSMSLEELGNLFPIHISEYSTKWPAIFEMEKKRILDSFEKSLIVQIDHIGSTAIPGLKAKPTIDILLQVSEQIDLQELKQSFLLLGYQLTEQPDNPSPHITFLKGYTEEGYRGQAFHVHIRYKGDWDEIRFRDYLRKHKEIAKQYESLKLRLASKYKNDREAYTNSKTEFIEEINRLAQR